MIKGLKIESFSVTGIYAIERLSTGDCYVGQAINIRKRWVAHRQDFKNDRHSSKFMQRIFNRHGLDAFRFIVLEVCGAEDLTEREAAWIERLKPLYNACPASGSCLGYHHSAETREKHRQKMFGNKLAVGKLRSKELRAKQSIRMRGNKFALGQPGAMMGKHHSEETKAKISKSKKGIPNLKRMGNPGRLKGTTRPLEVCQRISAGLMGHSVSEEVRRKISITKRARSQQQGLSL